MSDEPTEADLHRWLDGELGSADAARIEAFLERDERTRARLADYARNDQLLRSALATDDVAEPSPAIDDLERRLSGRLRRRGVRPIAALLVASAAAFVAGVATYPVLQGIVPWRVPPVVEAAIRAHDVLETTSRVEVPASARAELVERLERHLGADVLVPDLAAVGLSLVGGRLLVADEGPLAQIVYEDVRGSRLSVYFAGADTVEQDEITLVEVEDLTAGYWQGRTLAYSVIADMDPEILRQVAIEVSAAVEAAPRS
ncbi:anti-sigma factor family protein [Salinarimonas sp. NSM]|uniref:anti-sigma factor family protein n=1 Tax=Salinarimonas sp. NSM TaxID=3458003 RepID=UPI0040375EE0